MARLDVSGRPDHEPPQYVVVNAESARHIRGLIAQGLVNPRTMRDITPEERELAECLGVHPSKLLDPSDPFATNA